MRHVSAFDDSECLAFCLRLRSRLSALEGDHPEALRLCYEAMDTFAGQPDWWLVSVSELVGLLQTVSHRNEALAVLRQSIGVFRELDTTAARHVAILLEAQLAVVLTTGDSNKVSNKMCWTNLLVNAQIK